MKRILFALLPLILLSGCGSVPPAPVDRFYRLQPVSVPQAKAMAGAIAVQTFRADSLYAERPIVYAESANLRQLRQYHYHLWLYPPAQMVQNHLVASLGSALDFKGGSDAAYVLEGQVIGFERVISGGSSKAVLSLNLRLISSSGKPVIAKTYQAEHPASDDSLGDFVVAMEQALGRVYAEFAADVMRR